MKVYNTHVNDYPFVNFHRWEFMPLELIQLYTDNRGSDQELVDAVVKLDPVYVKFRELDALENRIGQVIERFGKDDVADGLPEDFHITMEMLQSVIMAKKELIQGTNNDELTFGRKSLLQIVNYLETKGVIEYIEK